MRVRDWISLGIGILAGMIIVLLQLVLFEAIC